MRQFEKFFVCPNCKAPLYRKSAMREKAINKNDYCVKCGARITSAKKKALAKIWKLS
ncbi:hypothetical protein [Eisenbergiella tayi]|uniref:hypothetical protein n=1 Tax=Eisenbergiella tayi TaxID=1432052 RepID=UPI001495AA15|nr:hypothetical protein [Eisenbergiella tayi]